MTDDAAQASRLRPFRKLRQVVAGAAMAGFEPLYREEGVPNRRRWDRALTQGQTIALWLAQRFPDMEIAAAEARYVALNQAIDAGEYGGDGSPGRDAAMAVQCVLEHFILTAPAATIESAKVRVRFWNRQLIEEGRPTSDALIRLVAERIAADFDAFDKGADESPPSCRMAGWRYCNPYAGER